MYGSYASGNSLAELQGVQRASQESNWKRKNSYDGRAHNNLAAQLRSSPHAARFSFNLRCRNRVFLCQCHLDRSLIAKSRQAPTNNFRETRATKHMEALMSRKCLPALVLISTLLVLPTVLHAAQTLTSLRLLYPSFAGSWGTAWIAKEAGYFSNEGLDVELIRVGGSTRMVAALLGGSAPIIQAGASAALAATAAGADVVIIGSTGTVSPFRLMARAEIKQPADLKGKKAGITTFGSTSDQVVHMALKHFNLEPNKDVALLSFGAQPEVFAALQSGAVQVGALSFPLYAKATKLGMRELVNFAELGPEDLNSTVIIARSSI